MSQRCNYLRLPLSNILSFFDKQLAMSSKPTSGAFYTPKRPLKASDVKARLLSTAVPVLSSPQPTGQENVGVSSKPQRPDVQPITMTFTYN